MTLVFKRRFAVVAALLVLLLASSSLANGQVSTGGGNGFRVSPVRSELVIEKGASQQITVNVENPTDNPVLSEAVVNDFISDDNENGEPRLILDDTVPPPKNSFKRLVLTPEKFELGPREKKDIVIDVRVPADANSGGYYGAIRFIPGSVTGTGNVGLTASVGTIILVRVPGNLTERLDLLELTAGQNGRAKSFLTSGDVSVISRLKNTGDIHVQPFGKVLIKDMFGNIVREFEFNNTEPKDNILPDSIRRFEDAVEKPGRGWLGRYTISINLGVSQGSGELITSSSTFWYVPTWALLVIFLLVLALAAGGYFLYKRFSVPKTRHGQKR